jgi:tetratricopeptide (TPR) repeat protein
LHEAELASVLGALGAPRGDAGRPGGLRAAMTRIVASLAADRVHLFVWDDAQEMDLESVDVLHGVVSRLRDARAVLLFAGRPREGAPHASIPGYVEIRLGPLEPDDVLRLVGLRMGVREVPEELLHFLAERAGGHPMFVEELLHEALESGALGVEDGRVTQMRLGGELAVPRPLRTLLGQRVRRLPAEERELLVAASVLGEPVDTAVLAGMLELPLGAVNALSESLEARELVRREGPVTLGFPSPLLPEVIYGGLAEAARVELHARAASAWQLVLGERTEEQAGRIAHHLAAAGDHQRAAGFHATAGLFHFQVRALDRAVADLVRALELVELERCPEHELEAWIGALARAVHHVRAGHSLPALVRRLSEHLERATEVAPRARARISVDLASILGSLHRYPEARALLDGVADRARAWPELSRAALAALAEVANRQGDFRTALDAVEQASALGPAEPAEEMRLHIAAAMASGGAGDIERAHAEIDRADRLAPPGDAVGACERAKVRALVRAFARDWRGSAEACAQAAEQGREARLLHDVAVNLHNQGESLMRLGELPRAWAVFQASLEVAEEIGTERLVNLNRLMLAFLDAANGSERAGFALGEHVTRAELNGWSWDAHTGRYLLGRLLRLRGDRAGAREELERARELATVAENRFLVEDCERELGELQ